MRFPLAKRVVVAQCWESLTIQRRDNEPVAYCLKVLIEACPVEIDVLALVLVEVESGGCKRTASPVANNWHRVLYQLADVGAWKKVTTPGSGRKTIFMPLKRFHGPAGEFEGLNHQFRRINPQLRGLGALAIETLDRHYFEKKSPEPFDCPASGSDAYFENAGQWTQRVAEAHRTGLIMEPQFDILPRPLQCIFEERKHDPEQEGKVAGMKLRKMYNDWNDEGGEKRRELEHGWIYQLENDETWYTGTKGTESELWEWLTTIMDSTYIGGESRC